MDNAGAKMRRHRRTPHHQYADDANAYQPSVDYQSLQNDSDDALPMERMGRGVSPKYRFENTIEAKVEDGDTLQALALRFHCTVADIKRLNKIDKDNEIHARKVVKIPVTVHSVLLGTELPTVHTSGSNTPDHSPKLMDGGGTTHSATVVNPLDEKRMMLSEKLMIASVNAAGGPEESRGGDAYFNLKTTRSAVYAYDTADGQNDALLDDILHDDDVAPRLRPIPGPSAFHAMQWSGSDCDMSWVCLFVVILALCFIIPLVCVIYFAEHAHHHNATASN